MSHTRGGRGVSIFALTRLSVGRSVSRLPPPVVVVVVVVLLLLLLVSCAGWLNNMLEQCMVSRVRRVTAVASGW